jgi:hypothetical protein
MKHSSGKILIVLLAVILVLLLLAPFVYQPVLVRAGTFLAAAELPVIAADAAILEGEAVLEKNAVSRAVELLRSGKVRRMLVVLHQYPAERQIFALPGDYPDLVKKELSRLPLPDSRFQVVSIPVRHPVTLSEAQTVMALLSESGVRSAVLLAKGFHMRRSYLVYRHVAAPMKIKIVPLAYYTTYRPDRWWQSDEGARDFCSEWLKLAYYQIRGYIPFKFSDA